MQAVAIIRETTVSGETFLTLDESTVLVKSASQPGEWHTLTLWAGRVSSCTCKGWQFRSDCRHARAFQSQGRAECEGCGHATYHRVGGRAVCCQCAASC